MVAFLYAQDVKKIYLPTNGSLRSQIQSWHPRCAAFSDKLMVLLQFDGQKQDTNRAMRDAKSGPYPRASHREFLGLWESYMQLTMTITLGVNDEEIGWVIETGMRHPHIKVVALQPVTYSGALINRCTGTAFKE